MKNTIAGFNQEYALSMRKTVKSKAGTEKTIKIDCTDLTILRWLVDFYPGMKKLTVDGREYVWLTHKKLLDDMPILDITKRSCIDRMQKLVEFGILDYKLVKDGGTFSLYAFGKNYMNLVQSTNTGVHSQPTQGSAVNQLPGMQSTNYPVCSQPDNKDKSIIDKSIKDNIYILQCSDEMQCSPPTNSNASIAEINNFFDLVWELYPVKRGKSEVPEEKRRELYEIGYDEIKRAVDRYLADLAKDADWRKPKNGSTFFKTGYVDYLDENYTPVPSSVRSGQQDRELDIDEVAAIQRMIAEPLDEYPQEAEVRP